jgi:hypothetical protein
MEAKQSQLCGRAWRIRNKANFGPFGFRTNEFLAAKQTQFFRMVRAGLENTKQSQFWSFWF